MDTDKQVVSMDMGKGKHMGVDMGNVGVVGTPQKSRAAGTDDLRVEGMVGLRVEGMVGLSAAGTAD